MSMLFGWLTSAGEGSARSTATDMLSALRSQPGQVGAVFAWPGLAIGALEGPGLASSPEELAPASSADGRFQLWFAGEAFCWNTPSWSGQGARRSRTLRFRQELLEVLISRGVEALRGVDGEFFVALWDAVERRLQLANDRFGGLPHYWSSTASGFAFAGGVRGVLMAPDVSAEPDAMAIREAVSFGGYRLRDRTNVSSTKMVPGGCVLDVTPDDDFRPRARRYWTWSDVRPVEAAPSVGVVQERLSVLWERAVGLRLDGARRPGQTLSGGLDSRAILAEAAPHAPRWTAITYGLPGCDDARFAQRAAAELGATWVFLPMYSGRDPDWFEARTRRIQETDGLIELSDLMHLESLELQADLLDVTLPGYIGDAVVGPTFTDVDTVDDVLRALPYYGMPIGLPPDEARRVGAQLVSEVDGAGARFAIFENKLPQSTNRWAAAWRPWVVVRKPFTDHALFDYCQGLPREMRREHRIYERWLLARYPRCFAAVPHQKTGVPILSPPWRLTLARGRRFVRRQVSSALATIGYEVHGSRRLYHDNERAWGEASVKGRIRETVLRAGSVTCEVLGRPAVTNLLDAWFEHRQAPAQAIAAVYVFEAYHRDLGAFLRSHRSR